MPGICREQRRAAVVRMPLATLDLLELGEQGSAVREPGDGRALSLQSKPALALAVGGNPVVGHKRTHLGRLYFVETVVSVSKYSTLADFTVLMAQVLASCS